MQLSVCDSCVAESSICGRLRCRTNANANVKAAVLDAGPPFDWNDCTKPPIALPKRNATEEDVWRLLRHKFDRPRWLRLIEPRQRERIQLKHGDECKAQHDRPWKVAVLLAGALRTFLSSEARADLRRLVTRVGQLRGANGAGFTLSTFAYINFDDDEAKPKQTRTYLSFDPDSSKSDVGSDKSSAVRAMFDALSLPLELEAHRPDHPLLPNMKRAGCAASDLPKKLQHSKYSDLRTYWSRYVEQRSKVYAAYSMMLRHEARQKTSFDLVVRLRPDSCNHVPFVTRALHLLARCAAQPPLLQSDTLAVLQRWAADAYANIWRHGRIKTPCSLWPALAGERNTSEECRSPSSSEPSEFLFLAAGIQSIDFHKVYAKREAELSVRGVEATRALRAGLLRRSGCSRYF